MPSNRLVTGCFAVLAAVAFGCGGGDDTTSPGPGEDPNQQVAEVTRTQAFGDGTYALLSVPGYAELDTLYLKQSGSQTLLRLELPDNQTDPILKAVYRRVAESQPWRVADLDVTEGTSWSVLSADTTLTDNLGSHRVILRFTVSFEGYEAVTVPARTFQQCYHGKLIQEVEVRSHTQVGDFLQTIDSDFQYWLADDVGLVKRRVRDQENILGQALDVLETADLEGATVQGALPGVFDWPLAVGNRWTYHRETTGAGRAGLSGLQFPPEQ